MEEFHVAFVPFHYARLKIYGTYFTPFAMENSVWIFDISPKVFYFQREDFIDSPGNSITHQHKEEIPDPKFCCCIGSCK